MFFFFSFMFFLLVKWHRPVSEHILVQGRFGLHVERFRQAELHFCTVWSYERTDRDTATGCPPPLGFVFQLESADCFNWDCASVNRDIGQVQSKRSGLARIRSRSFDPA